MTKRDYHAALTRLTREKGETPSLAEVAASFDPPVSRQTVYSAMKRLREVGLVHQDERGRYCPAGLCPTCGGRFEPVEV